MDSAQIPDLDRPNSLQIRPHFGRGAPRAASVSTHMAVSGRCGQDARNGRSRATRAGRVGDGSLVNGCSTREAGARPWLDPRTGEQLIAFRKGTAALSARASTRVLHAGYPFTYVRGDTHMVVVNPRRDTAFVVGQTAGARALLNRGVTVTGEWLALSRAEATWPMDPTRSWRRSSAGIFWAEIASLGRVNHAASHDGRPAAAGDGAAHGVDGQPGLHPVADGVAHNPA